MKTVLIVTHRRGFEADPVIDVLRERGIPVVRYNCEDGMATTNIAVYIKNDGYGIEFCCDGRTINGKDVGVAWYQQPPPFIGQPATIEQTLQRENLLAAHFGALSLLRCPWLNPPTGVHLAANKIVQLHKATETGLAIPTTLISNNPYEARNFCNKNLTVAKNLASPWINAANGTIAAYTKLVNLNWLKEDTVISFSPIIYQEFHRRKRDIRVVVVGNNIFTASCIPSSEQFEDIRRGEMAEHNYQLCEFNKSVLEKLRNLMMSFGLEYCSADFMEDEDGEIFFLDLNSCGAWWWIDRLYDGKICRTITDFLVSKLY